MKNSDQRRQALVRLGRQALEVLSLPHLTDDVRLGCLARTAVQEGLARENNLAENRQSPWIIPIRNASFEDNP